MLLLLLAECFAEVSFFFNDTDLLLTGDLFGRLSFFNILETLSIWRIWLLLKPSASINIVWNFLFFYTTLILGDFDYAFLFLADTFRLLMHEVSSSLSILLPFLFLMWESLLYSSTCCWLTLRECLLLLFLWLFWILLKVLKLDF